MSLPSFDIHVVHNNLFNKTCKINSLSADKEIRFYRGLVSLFLKCCGKIIDVKDSNTGKVYHLSAKAINDLLNSNTDEEGVDVSQGLRSVRDHLKEKDEVKTYTFQELMESEDPDEIFEFADDPVGKTKEEVFQLMERAAELGHVEAMRKVGYYYWLGEGVEADVEKAIPWLEEAGNKDDRLACQYLANIYWNGEGEVAQDRPEAKEWLLKGVGQGKIMLKENSSVWILKDDADVERLYSE